MLVLRHLGDNPLAAHHHVEGLPHEFIRSTAYWLHMDRPDSFNALVGTFLARSDIGCGR